MNKLGLFIGAHPDDIELGAGATLNRFLREGHIVHVLVLANCSDSLPSGYSQADLEEESRQSLIELEVNEKNIRFLDFNVRKFAQQRQEILQELVDINRAIGFDYVFAPSQNDIHQDHSTVAQEAIRAFKKQSIYQYSLPWNTYAENLQTFIEVSEEDIRAKVSALSMYRSQANRYYMDESRIRSEAIHNGSRVQMQFAEVFESPRNIHRLYGISS